MVVSLAFKSLEITLLNFQRQKNNDAALAHFALLDRLLTTDIHRSLKVTKLENGFKCLYPDGKMVDYYAYPEAIIRKQSVICDTFSLENATITFLFENKAESEVGKLLDKLNVDYLYKGIAISCIYTKDYTADMLQLNDTKQE